MAQTFAQLVKGISATNAPANSLTIDSSGRVGIGVTGPQHLCQIAGTLAVDSYNDTSKTITLRPGFEANANGGMGLVAKDHSGAAPDGLGIYGTDGVSVHTANAGTFFERFRVDTSGRLLVGTSTATSTANTAGNQNIQVQGTSNYAAISVIANVASGSGGYLTLAKSRSTTPGGFTVVNSGDELGAISFEGADGSAYRTGAYISAQVDGTPGASDMPCRLTFSTCADGASNATQAMVIDSSQNVNITKSTASLSTTGWYGVSANSTVGSISISRNGSNVMAFFHTSNANALAGTPVGTVSITTTATTYATSSDYRLKENVVPLTGAIDRINQLKPSQFNFIADPDKTVDGFLAHEAQEVVPECATGAKDEVDAEGNPIYQGIDQSKLVPLLTAALQEALQKIDAMEARLAALEGA